MRLLIVAQTSSPHTPKWARAFAARGDDVLVVSQSPEPIAAPMADSENDGAAAGSLAVERFPPPGAWWAKLPRERMGGGWQRWIAGYPAWRRCVRAFAPEIVHVHFLTADPRNHFYFSRDLVPRLVASAWGSDVVFDPPPSARVAGHLRALLGRADRVTATTHFLAEETRRFDPSPSRPIDVIGFGVDPSIFRPRVDAERLAVERPLRIGWAKGLETMYGTETLIEMFNRLHAARPGTELVIAGAGSQDERLRRGFAAGGSLEAVRFLGRVPPAEVAEMLRNVDVFVMPSICRESFGVAALEAAACGVPVVASDTGGIPEAVRHGETGWLVPPGDATALLGRVTALLEAPEQRRAFGAAGRAFAADAFPWERSVEAMAGVYEELLRERAA